MNKEKITIEPKETEKEFYKISNNTCPICEKKIDTLTNIVKIGNVGYHLNCIDKIK